MKTDFNAGRHPVRILLLAGGLFASVCVSAHEPVQQPSFAIAVQDELASAAAGVTDLKFREFFKLPIGPRGLEPSEKLVSLVGKRVRLVGYMARQENPTPGFFVLSPLPVTLGDEDESLADDLPASVIYVHAAASEGRPLPYYSGLLRLTGTLSLGAFEESDGRVSSVRMQLDPKLTQAMDAQPSK